MALGWAIVGSALIGAGATAFGATQGPGSPDYSAASAAAIWTDLQTLPARRTIEAAARTGGRVFFDDTWWDFSGMSDADIAAKNADLFAQKMLEIQKKYGAEFVAQRLQELQQSDPEGWAARKQMYQLIQDSIARPADTRMNQAVADQIMAELQQGGQLSDDVRREVEQQVRRGQAARGNTHGNAALFQEAQEVGMAAERRKAERLARAQSWLTSGATPDDVEFRRFQQNLANLGSYVEGRTPVSQFGQLSGAQSGAAPFVPGASMPGLDPNAGARGAQFALDRYAATPNPWMQGIAGGLAGANVGLGWAQLSKK